MHHYIVAIANIAHVNPRCVREFTVMAPCLPVAWDIAEDEAGLHEMVMAVVPATETVEAV